MRYLLDINALIALAHTDHEHHRQMIRWYASISENGAAVHTCSISELGFVRVSVQVGLQRNVSEAREALARLKASGRPPFSLINDGMGVDSLPPWAKSPRKLTDGHLLGLANAHGAALVTLDKGIPEAVLVR